MFSVLVCCTLYQEGGSDIAGISVMFLGKTVPHRALADPRSFFLGTKLLLSLRTFHHFYPLVSLVY